MNFTEQATLIFAALIQTEKIVTPEAVERCAHAAVVSACEINRAITRHRDELARKAGR